MTEENIGDIRIGRLGFPQQGHGVLHGGKPAAVEVALDAVLAHGLAVTHVILGNH